MDFIVFAFDACMFWETIQAVSFEILYNNMHWFAQFNCSELLWPHFKATAAQKTYADWSCILPLVFIQWRWNFAWLLNTQTKHFKIQWPFGNYDFVCCGGNNLHIALFLTDIFLNKYLKCHTVIIIPRSWHIKGGQMFMHSKWENMAF